MLEEQPNGIMPFKGIQHRFFGSNPVVRPGRIPSSKSDIVLYYCGLLFLIAVATFLPIKAVQDYKYLDNRHTRVIEECVVDTGDFNWCWYNLTL